MSEIKTNKLSSATSNSDITIDPDGTGDVVVASGHKLGVGTTSPQSDLSVKVSASRQLDVIKDSGDDHLVLKSSAPDASYNMRSIELAGEKVAFSTGASSGTSYTERMRINSSGNVYIGGTGAVINSDSKLGVHGRIDASVSSTTPLSLNRSGSDGVIIDFGNDGSFGIGNVSVSGSSVSFNTSSDHRLKENVADMTGAIARVKQLAPKRFNFIADTTDTLVDGFLAHEAQTVVPEAVHGEHNEVDDDGNAVMQGIDQAKLVPLLTGALQEAIAKIETLETKVAALEAAE
jgi:hypothetical protein